MKGNRKETTFLPVHEKKTNLESHRFSSEEATNSKPCHPTSSSSGLWTEKMKISGCRSQGKVIALPNYMKSTTSADAREQAKVRRKPLDGIRSSMKRAAGIAPEVSRRNLQVERVTCSSSLKGSKSLDCLKIGPGGTGPEGTSGMEVCPYSRCSLNGHVHALLPPLKRCVSQRKQALKTELIGRDVATTSEVWREQIGDLVLTEREETAAPVPNTYPQSSVQEASSEILEQHCVESMEKEKGKPYPTNLVDGYGCTPKIITSAEFKMNSDDRSGRFFDEESQESIGEESLNSDTLFAGKICDSVGSFNYLKIFCNKKPSALTSVTVTEAPNLLGGPAEETATSVDSATCKVIKHDQVSNQNSSGETSRLSDKSHTSIVEKQDGMKNECNQAESFDGVCTKDFVNESHPAVSRRNSNEVNSRNMEMQKTGDKSSRQATVKCEKSNQHSDQPTCFNPRELHLVPLEPDPEAEKVNLRHQDLDARKNAEEWMVDYALRQAVTKIGSSPERKVASLVEAFERVLPTSKG